MSTINLNQSPYILYEYQKEAVRRIMKSRHKKPILTHIATGGGKTVIIADLCKQWISQSKNPKPSILIVSKNWELLKQQVNVFNRHIEHLNPKILFRLGGENTCLHDLSNIANQRIKTHAIILTTLSSFKTQKNNLKQKLSYIIWDECHWADKRLIGNHLMKYSQHHKIKLIGFTATPKSKSHSLFKTIIYSKDLVSLMNEKFILSPNIVKVNTLFEWQTQLNQAGDYSQDSLLRLNHLDRNQLIVKHYLTHKASYTKTIVFCANIEQADKLSVLFAKEHIPVGVVHHKLNYPQRKRAIQRFRDHSLDVLINVNILTHGIDLPEIDTIFIARPTRSAILYLQMVGRGVRKNKPTDLTFNLVEFVDLVHDLELTPLQWDHLYGDQSSRIPRNNLYPNHIRRRQHLYQHVFNDQSAPVRLGKHAFIPESCESLWIYSGQSFGLELEITSAQYNRQHFWGVYWQSKARAIICALQECFDQAYGCPSLVCNKPLNYKRGKHHQWNVERDGSAGWEVKSRILRSIDGAQELAMICHKLDLLAKQHHLKVNARTGLHLHLGFPNDLVSLQRLVILMHFFEPALSSIVAPSRVFAFDYNNRSYKTQMTNPYCKPISKILDLDLIMQLTHIDQLKEYYRHVSRGGSLNIKPLLTMRTVEFRLHSGTLDSTKVLLWLSVCQQLVHAALFPNDEVKKLMKRRVVTRHYMLPQFNLSELAKTYLPDGHNQSFIHAIKHREAQIRKYWINNLHLRPILDRLMA